MAPPVNTPEYWKDILYLVSIGEGAYESRQPSTVSKGVSEGTIYEAWLEQKRHKNPPNITAAIGRYQFVGTIKSDGIYFKNAATGAGLDWKEDLFSPINQDKMAVYVIIGFREITREMIQNNPVEAALRLAKEWASLPVLETVVRDGVTINPGESYWKNVGDNNAKVTIQQVKNAFARFLGKSPSLTSYGGLAAAGETPALSSKTAGTGEVDVASGLGMGFGTPNPVVTQRETPLVSVDEMLDLLRKEKEADNRPINEPKLSAEHLVDKPETEYKASLYASSKFKQNVKQDMREFYGIITEIASVPKEELGLRNAQDLAINYALINDQPDLQPEKIAYIFPLVDGSGNIMPYLSEDPKIMTINKSVQYEAIYDRMSFGTDVSGGLEAGKIVKVRHLGVRKNRVRIIGAMGMPTTMLANMIGGGSASSMLGFGSGGLAGLGDFTGEFGQWSELDGSPPARIVGPTGPNVWNRSIDDIVAEADGLVPVNGLCDLSVIPYLAVNIVYGSPNNFIGQKWTGYEAQKGWCACKMIPGIFKAAKKAHGDGYAIIFYDGYRPLDAQFFAADWATAQGYPCLVYRFKAQIRISGEPNPVFPFNGKKCVGMIADPLKKSKHNFGAAFDSSLYKIEPNHKRGDTVQSLDFGGPFDNVFDNTEAEYTWPGANENQRANRRRLNSYLVGQARLRQSAGEWWHYDVDLNNAGLANAGYPEPKQGTEYWIK